MKIRIALTLIVIGMCAIPAWIWNSVESPMRGAATAAQLDDTLQSWIVANTIRSNFVEASIAALCVAGLLVIWWPTAKPKTTK